MKETDTLAKQLLLYIEKLETQIKALVAENEELKRRLNSNSQNSSKPPSSDGLGRPGRMKSLRVNGQKKSGGQPGHQGQTLERAEKPDSIVSHPLTNCPHCASDIKDEACIGIEKRQVFDIPQPQLAVTEHQAEIKWCPCCKIRVKAPFPMGVNTRVQYGPTLQSFALYLQHQHFIPEDRLEEVFADLFKIKIASSTLSSFGERLHNSLDGFEKTVLLALQQAPVKHLDETGFRIGGKTQWLHVASNEALTYYHASAKRKSLLSGLMGTVVHDHWHPYFQLPEVHHALCNAHHLRELNALIEAKETWAKRMKRILCVGLALRKHYGPVAIPPTKLNRIIEWYDHAIQAGLAFHEALSPLSQKSKRGKPKRRTGHNLLLRLRDHCADTLRFLTDPLVPFTNNQAERDIRMMKCKQKISGGFRSTVGAQQFARIRGFISTAKKQGWNVFESLVLALAGRVPMLG